MGKNSTTLVFFVSLILFSLPLLCVHAKKLKMVKGSEKQSASEIREIYESLKFEREEANSDKYYKYDFLKVATNRKEDRGVDKIDLEGYEIIVRKIADQDGMPEVSSKAIKNSFNRADTSGSGRISYEQFITEMKSSLDILIEYYRKKLQQAMSEQR